MESLPRYVEFVIQDLPHRPILRVTRDLLGPLNGRSYEGITDQELLYCKVPLFRLIYAAVAILARPTTPDGAATTAPSLLTDLYFSSKVVDEEIEAFNRIVHPVLVEPESYGVQMNQGVFGRSLDGGSVMTGSVPDSVVIGSHSSVLGRRVWSSSLWALMNPSDPVAGQSPRCPPSVLRLVLTLPVYSLSIRTVELPKMLIERATPTTMSGRSSYLAEMSTTIRSSLASQEIDTQEELSNEGMMMTELDRVECQPPVQCAGHITALSDVRAMLMQMDPTRYGTATFYMGPPLYNSATTDRAKFWGSFESMEVGGQQESLPIAKLVADGASARRWTGKPAFAFEQTFSDRMAATLVPSSHGRVSSSHPDHTAFLRCFSTNVSIIVVVSPPEVPHQQDDDDMYAPRLVGHQVSFADGSEDRDRTPSPPPLHRAPLQLIAPPSKSNIDVSRNQKRSPLQPTTTSSTQQQDMRLNSNTIAGLWGKKPLSASSLTHHQYAGMNKENTDHHNNNNNNNAPPSSSSSRHRPPPSSGHNTPRKTSINVGSSGEDIVSSVKGLLSGGCGKRGVHVGRGRQETADTTYQLPYLSHIEPLSLATSRAPSMCDTDYSSCYSPVSPHHHTPPSHLSSTIRPNDATTTTQQKQENRDGRPVVVTTESISEPVVSTTERDYSDWCPPREVEEDLEDDEESYQGSRDVSMAPPEARWGCPRQPVRKSYAA